MNFSYFSYLQDWVIVTENDEWAAYCVSRCGIPVLMHSSSLVSTWLFPICISNHVFTFRYITSKKVEWLWRYCVCNYGHQGGPWTKWPFGSPVRSQSQGADFNISTLGTPIRWLCILLLSILRCESKLLLMSHDPYLSHACMGVPHLHYNWKCRSGHLEGGEKNIHTHEKRV